MDIREFALWHKASKVILIEKKKENLYHARLAANGEGESYEKEFVRLEDSLRDCYVNKKMKVPQTKEEQKEAMKGMALALGLKVNKKQEVTSGV